ncbi:MULTISPECIES: DUF2569 domain-containing protein [Scandinavium]|jgi:hypothetical protein|uniref:DUF2569 domain-containing protein n=1 Tax=Scandinavium lactucae TaxID=3095028 RepID=A0ABU4QRY7_9ENTR|nr:MULTISPECIES: DUF2569 domain-containing protein [unclassified Scandinavium]MDX6042050.1 DUF2569 domain-containing protein [Scandinavium sp. V105_6]MDX6052051.1 DUF2569 domain-containing protein [Scandinavium sp. V105_1]
MSTEPTERIGGWLFAPLAWLIVALISASLAILLYAGVLLSPAARSNLGALSATNLSLWLLSMVFAVAMWAYTFWLTAAFFKRRKLVPKHYIIWLLISVLLAVKAFAFAPVSDALALRQLLFPLLATALLVPYFKRSTRVKRTFVNP